MSLEWVYGPPTILQLRWGTYDIWSKFMVHVVLKDQHIHVAHANTKSHFLTARPSAEKDATNKHTPPPSVQSTQIQGVPGFYIGNCSGG